MWTKTQSTSIDANSPEEKIRSDYHTDYKISSETHGSSYGSDERHKYTSEAYVDTRRNNSIENGSSLMVYPLEKYKIQQDPCPIVIRKLLAKNGTHLRQNVIVRYFRPPKLPTPGPLIIREIRAPQIPPAPPLVIRQRPPNPPSNIQPLILRERPPLPPKVDTQAKIITKKLPPLPPPARVERYPPMPPKPRDIIIERWLPYQAAQRRKVIYQRAHDSGVMYTPKKNMIIQYQYPKTHVERVFQREEAVEADPRLYVSKFGYSLMDSVSLEHSARQIGVVEDISVPIGESVCSSEPNYLYESNNHATNPSTDHFMSELYAANINTGRVSSPLTSEILVNDQDINSVGESKEWSSNATLGAGYDSGIYMPDRDYRNSSYLESNGIKDNDIFYRSSEADIRGENVSNYI